MTNKNILPQQSNYLNQEWYQLLVEECKAIITEADQLLVEECKAIITEAEFTSRWALVEGYHQLGERILQENENFERAKIYGKKIVSRVTESLEGKASQRTVWRSIQFAKKYPSLDLLPEGKNTSWRDICNKYLPVPKEKIEPLIPAKGKYQVIVIDPPWNYGTEYNAKSRRIASPYPEIPTDKLKEFNIPSDKNSIIWLWTTHKFLPDAFELLKVWGFEYKANFVWNKQKMGMGVWLRMQVEFCLLGIKGNPQWKLTNERDILSVARREHSRKPDEFYNMVKKLTPNMNRIDIFSRETREGFKQYGNEPDKF